MKTIPRQLMLRCFRAFTSLSYGRVVTKTIHGIRYELDLSEMIDSALYFRGRYEKFTTRLLQEYVQPDMIVFEVGANIGAHTFRIAQRLATGSGMLYSFEPTVYAFSKLERNFSLNDFHNIVLERIALADVNEEREIHRASSQETMPFAASWDNRTHSAKHASVDLMVFRRLDDYFQERELPALDLLKIDTDGYEMRVLEGGRRTIERHRPILVIELGTTVERVGDSLEQLVARIDDLGYTFRSVETRAQFDRNELIETVRRRRTMDCLCLPRAA